MTQEQGLYRGQATAKYGVDSEGTVAKILQMAQVSTRLDEEDNSVFGGRPFSNLHSVFFRAQDIYKDRYGTIKAKISIRMNDWPILAWGTIHIDKHEDRIRLCNQAWKKLDDTIKVLYPVEVMHHDFDEWCYWIWPTSLGSVMAEELAGAVIPVQFLVHPYVIKGGGTILVGSPGGGKTYMSLLMAISIDSGSPDFFRVDDSPHKVLFINLERSASSIQNRIAACNRVLGFEAGRPLLVMNQRGRSLMDLRENVKAVIEKHKVELVVLDSISRSTNGQSLTEDTSGNRIIDCLNGLSETWVAIAHNTRSDSNHVYGSIMFDAGADIIVKLTSQAEENKLGMVSEIIKANDVGQYPKKYVAMEFNENGLCGVRSAREGEFTELEGKIITDIQKVHNHLAQNGSSTIKQIVEATGIKADSVRVYVNRMDDVQVVASTGSTKLYGLALT